MKKNYNNYQEFIKNGGEKYWQEFWQENKTNFCDLNDETKKKFYNLVMFFYPSGAKIHIGHGYNYTGPDVFGRYKRMKGFNVFEPMGYDAFGLPAENYAIKTGQHPALTTETNIEFGKGQLKELGLMYDWEKEINTSKPEYYKWTQWLFGILYQAGLAYRKEAPVNWCPSCKTVLANEQVIVGKCERCESEVIQKNLKQWFFKITDYADKLLESHKKINWPEKTILMQKNWIGRSEGAEVMFEIVGDINDVEINRLTPPLKWRVNHDDNAVNRRLQSAEEKDKTVCQRPINWSLGEEVVSLNPPLKWWVNQEEKLFFVTFPTHERQPFFQYNKEAKIILDLFNRIIKEKNYQVIDLAVMPEHVHLIVKRGKKEDLEKIIQSIKGVSSRYYKRNLPHLWAKSFEYEIIENQESLDRVLNYLKNNPKKKGLKKDNRLLSDLDDSYELKVFTTRPDTLFGATFMVVAPEHPLVNWWLKRVEDDILVNRRLQSAGQGDDTTTPRPLKWSRLGEMAPVTPPINWWVNQNDIDAVKTYINETRQKSDLERTDLAKEKTGMELKGIKAINPVNGKEIPIFVADYVLSGYGTGAIMAVPAHDERDFEFAKKYNLAILQVAKPLPLQYNVPTASDSAAGILQSSTIELEPKCFVGDGIAINSGEFDGLNTAEFKEKIINWLEEKGLGKREVNYRLRDWLISRQRYWGAPIPIIYCDRCGEVLVDEKNLPVKLPELENFKPTDDGESPLARSSEFVNVKCPKCGGMAKRSTETMDTFVCSSWYYLRYLSPTLTNEPFDKKLMTKWLPVDQYCGGAEHACMHLLYARFITKVLFDHGFINFDEPFLKLNHQGMILAADGTKMSKSKGNVVIPDDYVKKYGADVFRTYVLFLAPFEQGGAWSDHGIVGVKRFLEKVWNMQDKIKDNNELDSRWSLPRTTIRGGNDKLRLSILLNQTIKKVGEDIENFHFNTAISQMMILVNEMEKIDKLPITNYQLLITLLSPFAPHICEELWQRLGNKNSLVFEKWPEYDKKLIQADEFELVVQINGKVRDKIMVAADISEAEAIKAAMNLEKVKKWLEGKEPKKVIYIKGKLLSIVG